MTLDEFRTELTDFLSETGWSKNALASKAKVPQSQVSNWSCGGGKRFTENAHKVMQVIESYRKKNKRPMPAKLENAVRQAWGGDPHRVSLICDVLMALEKHKGCA